MEKCSICGKNAFVSEKINDITMCVPCSLKLHYHTWKNKEYNSNESVEQQKVEVIKLANKYNFAEEIIKKIDLYFESKKIEGLIKKIDGGVGQTLYVFEDYCIIYTDDEFDYPNIKKEYYKIITGQKEAPIGEDLLFSQSALSMMSSFVGGGSLTSKLVRAGTNVALQSMANKNNNKQIKNNSRKIELSIQKGEEQFRYSDYDKITYFNPLEIDDDDEESNDLGFLKLQHNNTEYDSYYDVLFFYDDNEEEIMEAYNYILKRIKEINKHKQKTDVITTQANNNNNIFDELRQYKKLLDEGVITQEEFDAKKKQIMGI